MKFSLERHIIARIQEMRYVEWDFTDNQKHVPNLIGDVETNLHLGNFKFEFY